MRLRQLVAVAALFAAFTLPAGCSEISPTSPTAPSVTYDVQPIPYDVALYFEALVFVYYETYGTGGECGAAIDRFWQKWNGVYGDAQDDSYGMTNMITRSIQINQDRLGDPYNDMDTLFHEAYHSSHLFGTESGARNFAASCMNR